MEERKKRGMEVEKSRKKGGRRIQGVVELHTSVHLPPFVEGHPQYSCLTASPVPSIPPPSLSYTTTCLPPSPKDRLLNEQDVAASLLDLLADV